MCSAAQHCFLTEQEVNKIYNLDFKNFPPKDPLSCETKKNKEAQPEVEDTSVQTAKIGEAIQLGAIGPLSNKMCDLRCIEGYYHEETTNNKGNGNIAKFECTP